MDMAKFEKEILAELKAMTGNPKLKLKDLLEWSLSEFEPREGERLLRLPVTRVFVAFPELKHFPCH